MNTLTDLFWNYSDSALPGFTLLALLPAFKKVWKQHHLLLLYLAVTCLMMGVADYMADRGINNLYLYHMYALIECSLLVVYVEQLSLNNKKLIFALIGIFFIYWCINIIFLESYQSFNGISLSIESLLISFCCFRYLLSLTQKEEIMFFQKLPGFWIVSGLLFYHMCSFLIMLLYKNWHFFNDLTPVVIWNIIEVLNLVKFIIIAIGILCIYRYKSPELFT
ncbi:MAG: hypothetical protein KGO81_11270 [Bacteroidota bacterium]|nr:hypothetical protein [Bacteroidota bacterium]